MRKTDIYRYYAFGHNYHVLRLGCGGMAIASGGASLLDIVASFFEHIDRLDLPVTREAAKPLREIGERAKKLDATSMVDEALSTEIRTAVSRFDATLDAELKLRFAYVLTPKRFPLTSLLEKPGDLFATGVFEALPVICQFDFSRGAECIAYAQPTAAAFHIMRGAEGVLRHYYCAIVKKGRVPKLMWAEMVSHLRNRRKCPPKALLDNLDNMRVNFRNPTQHPDARYDMDEAQDLFSLAIDVVNRMLRDLAKRAQ